MIVGGGFSFDWGLVQPAVAKFTRVCTYDPSGTAWSDQVPSQQRLTCALRVGELHQLLQKANIRRPAVLVGYSIGAPAARLYAAKYPEEVSGLILVDHAFNPQPATTAQATPPTSLPASDSPPILLSAPALDFDISDDQNFAKLPKLNRELHLWAQSLHPDRPGAEDIADCQAEIKANTGNRADPLGALPLIVVSTPNDSPGYGQLQTHLLALSRTSEHLIAQNSWHMVLIDEPEVIVTAIHKVFEKLR